MQADTQVYLADTGQGIAQAVSGIFNHFGGLKAMLKPSRDVYLKVNAVDSQACCYTDPQVIEAVIRHAQAQGARDVYVIENCTQGNFTRLVFKATGILDACRRTGATPVHLDETGATPVFLDGLESFVDISSFVHERLMVHGKDNLYISLPKLKTHSMSGVTLSIKNQFGFVHQASRIPDHNYRLHQKFADIHRLIRPDFVVVDGLIATNHGHYIARSNANECIAPMNCLIGGPDSLAVDTVAAAIMGFPVDKVEHLRLCAAMGLGQSDLSRITLVNEHLFHERKKDLTCELLERFPPGLDILRGRERCCTEGCRRNTETLVEFLHGDFGGKGGFTILMGKGIDPEEAAAVQGPVHIAGSCAVEEWGALLTGRLGRRNVTCSPGCNNLAQSISGLCKHMGVSPLRLSQAPLLTSLACLVAAKARGTRALIPPLL